jgi:hypothetical protein
MRIILTLLVLSLNLLFSDGGVLRVDWSKATISRQKLKVLPKSLKDGIKDVTLPVYMPNSYIYQKNLSIVADKNFYAITIFLKGATLMISGDRTYQEQIKVDIKKTSEKFTHAEGIATLDFQKNGVNYSLVLECDSPNSDSRCKSDSFLSKIYRRLVLVGGRR